MKKIFILVIYLALAYFFISLTPTSVALMHDAKGYFDLASQFSNQGILSSFYSISPTFIDRGYPLILSVIIKFFGSNQIFLLQLLNYLFWLSACWFIYLSLSYQQVRRAKLPVLLMLFSPLFLSFSAKLYSEPFAALGIALLTFAHTNDSGKWTKYLAYFVGAFILVSSKSIFLPIILIFSIYVFKRSPRSSLAILLALLVLIPGLIASFRGGRSSYNLAIQSSKLDQSYDQIIACAPYYISYPIGQFFLPQYQGVCHQNNPTPNMSGYQDNPYVNAELLRKSGFSYLDWFNRILSHPLEYLLSSLVGLSNFLFFEGIYPSISTLTSFTIQKLIFVTTRVGLSLFLWYRILFKLPNIRYLLPLGAYLLLIMNYQVEPRYLYPLFPYLYFLLGLSYARR